MPLKINEILVDGLTADPTSPADGELWYRSDLFEWRLRKNGNTKKIASRGTDSGDDDVPKCNRTTSDPGINDDSSAGYTHCSLWINTTSSKVWCCEDESVGAAVWIDLTATGGGGEANTTSNAGTGEGTLAKAKSGVNLPIKSIKQGTNITVTNNADDVTIATTATVNDTDANLKNRANHTGTQTMSTISDAGSLATKNTVATGDIDNDAVDNTKLANMAANSIKGNNTGSPADAIDMTAAQTRTLLNVADGATANDTDANLKNRANHTGTQTASTISDFDTEVSNNTDVTANTAKVSFPEAPNDGTQYTRKNLGWEAVAGAPPTVLEVSGTSTLSKTNNTVTVVSGMQHTSLGAGDYAFWFNGMVDFDNRGIPCAFQVYVNGSAVAATYREESAGRDQVQGDGINITITGKVTVGSGQTLDIRWWFPGSTATCRVMQRSLMIMKTA